MRQKMDRGYNEYRVEDGQLWMRQNEKRLASTAC